MSEVKKKNQHRTMSLEKIYSYGIDCSKDFPFQISTLNIIHLSILYFDHGMHLLTVKRNTVHTYIKHFCNPMRQMWFSLKLLLCFNNEITFRSLT